MKIEDRNRCISRLKKGILDGLISKQQLDNKLDFKFYFIDNKKDFKKFTLVIMYPSKYVRNYTVNGNLEQRNRFIVYYYVKIFYGSSGYNVTPAKMEYKLDNMINDYFKNKKGLDNYNLAYFNTNEFIKGKIEPLKHLSYSSALGGFFCNVLNDKFFKM